MMLILAVDTSTSRSSVALATPNGLLAGAALTRPTGHGGFLVPAIAFCLREAGVGMGDVDGVAVTLGPGLFTGMRVGIATAQSLAHARSLPVVGAISLEVLASRLRHAGRPVWPVLDARRKELFWGRYAPTPDGMRPLAQPEVGPPERLAEELEREGGRALCVGDGAMAHRALLEAAGAEVAVSAALAHPDAESLAELALPRFLDGRTERAQALAPVYLRDADARIGWQQRGVLAGGAAPEPAERP